jgi:hypothetical protein
MLSCEPPAPCIGAGCFAPAPWVPPLHSRLGIPTRGKRKTFFFAPGAFSFESLVDLNNVGPHLSPHRATPRRTAPPRTASHRVAPHTASHRVAPHRGTALHRAAYGLLWIVTFRSPSGSGCCGPSLESRPSCQLGLTWLAHVTFLTFVALTFVTFVTLLTLLTLLILLALLTLLALVTLVAPPVFPFIDLLLLLGALTKIRQALFVVLLLLVFL